MTPAPMIQATRGEEFPRTLTAPVTDFGEFDQLEPLFERLAEDVQSLNTETEVMGWIERWSELNAAVDEEYSRRYIAMTCATDDEDLEKAYLHMVEKVVPRLKPWSDRLARLYLECPARQRADRHRLEVFDRALENQANLFREENIALQTEDSKLGQQYQKVCGAMTVTWEGKELTLQQLAPIQEEMDREKREAAWRLAADRRLADRETLDGIYDQMIELRGRIAANAGFENFRDYQHAAYDRFDYAPKDCMTFHDAVEREVVPLLRERRALRREAMGIDALRPWDLSVDSEGKPPLRPFKDSAQLEEGCSAIFKGLSPELGDQFEQMRRLGLLDLESRKGKAPGGYQSTLEEVRLPFIFMNAAGTNRDVFTLLHEGGHAFHSFASRNDPILAYRHAPMEFCEVASMSMELFGLDGLGEAFYSNEQDARRARRRHLEDLVSIFPWVATIDAFQHWVYTHPGHTAEAREAAWIEILDRFDSGVDWTGLDAERRSMWHRQLHLFEVPFYYIEYGIAQLGALQLWAIFRQDPAAALAGYRRALALGGSRPLPELFETAGIRFDFSEATLRPVMQAVGEALAEADR